MAGGSKETRSQWSGRRGEAGLEAGCLEWIVSRNKSYTTSSNKEACVCGGSVVWRVSYLRSTLDLSHYSFLRTRAPSLPVPYHSFLHSNTTLSMKTTTTTTLTNNSFLQDLQALEFPLYWNSTSEVASTFTTRTEESMNSNEIPMANTKKKNCQPQCQEWSQGVRVAMFNLRRIHSLRERYQEFDSSQLFSIDGCRYTVRSKMIQVFEIFPWFLLAPTSPNHRYRESLSVKKAESIDIVTAAINFFWSQSMGEEDLSSLESYFLGMGSAPQRTLWALVDLKTYLEKDRLYRHTAGAQMEIRELSSRLSALEEKVKMLLAGRQPNLPINNKRKLDSLVEESKENSSKKRVEVLEHIVDGLVNTTEDQDREGETTDDASSSSSCDRDEEVDWSEFESERSDESGYGLDVPNHYLEEDSLQQYKEYPLLWH